MTNKKFIQHKASVHANLTIEFQVNKLQHYLKMLGQLSLAPNKASALDFAIEELVRINSNIEDYLDTNLPDNEE